MKIKLLLTIITMSVTISGLQAQSTSGKTVIPFITHEGSRMGNSVSDIKKLCPKSVVQNGLPIRGGSVKDSQQDILKWLKEAL